MGAAMEGYRVMTLESCLSFADIYVTATGNYNIITATHMSQMKNNAIVGNIGHFDNEIDMAGLIAWEGIEHLEITIGRQLQVPNRKLRHHPRRWTSPQPRLCHRTSILRHVQQLHQLGHRTDGAMEQQGHRQVRELGVQPPQAPRRESRPPTSRRCRSGAHSFEQGPSRLHRS